MTAPIADGPKRGRPPKQPCADAANRILALATDGFSMRGVAAGLDVSQDTLRKWFDEHPALQEAFDNGRENERHALHNMLYRQAMEKGNASAAMFLLKSRHGYREGDQNETGNRLQINFQLPGAISMGEFLKVKALEHGPTSNRDQHVSTERVAATRGS